MVQKIPFFHQRTEYYCGPAIIQMVLAAYDIKVTQRQAAHRAKTDKLRGVATGAETGTPFRNLVGALRSYGVRVSAQNHRSVPEMRRALKKKKIVIVCFTERKFGWGHYAIVTRIRPTHIDLLDPAEHLGKGKPMTLAEFQKRWKDPTHTRSRRWAAFVEKKSSTE